MVRAVSGSGGSGSRSVSEAASDALLPGRGSVSYFRYNFCDLRSVSRRVQSGPCHSWVLCAVWPAAARFDSVSVRFRGAGVTADPL